MHPGKVASGVALAIDEETKGLVRPVIESNLRLAKQIRCRCRIECQRKMRISRRIFSGQR
ncbi:hypothetical protein B4096_3691 [Heyndrickxia coagulans]|nr:hypothetical protein B4096_3691 [Heyndrickxia coagulans]